MAVLSGNMSYSLKLEVYFPMWLILLTFVKMNKFLIEFFHSILNGRTRFNNRATLMIKPLTGGATENPQYLAYQSTLFQLRWADSLLLAPPIFSPSGITVSSFILFSHRESKFTKFTFLEYTMMLW